MTQTARLTFQEELVKLHSLVVELAEKVKTNGELLLEFLTNKDNVNELFLRIKTKDREIDKARWEVHDFGDQLIVLQQPVAKDFRQIITSIQVTDNLERIGDHFKKTARLLEKISLSDIEAPQEILNMAKLGIKMLTESTNAYSQIVEGKTNEIAELDDQVDILYKQTIAKITNLIKHATEEKIDSISKLFFIAQSFERAADHAAKIAQLVNYAATGIRHK